METIFPTALESYVRAKHLAKGTQNEYFSTLKKWEQWGAGAPLEQLNRRPIREFLDWLYQRAIAEKGNNPGRTTNNARDHLRAVISWAWEQDLMESTPRFPKPKPQRVVAGLHYLTKEEINALYFATHKMRQPCGWSGPFPIGRYWRSALVVFFNYGVDTGTIFQSATFHEPILWRHVFWQRESQDREVKAESRWGWLFYRRVKTNKSFFRPMNRVVHAHIKSLMTEKVEPDEHVFVGGGSRPNSRFQEQCNLAGIEAKFHLETGKETPWLLKDLRKTCATH